MLSRTTDPGPSPTGLSVRVDGRDVGRPSVVFEAGLGASSIGWAGVRQHLAGQTRMISYDRAGLGASPRVGGRRGLAELVDDLADVVRAHGGQRPVVLVGHSLGATLAHCLARVRPELVAGLVLIDPIPERWVLRYAAWGIPVGQLAYLGLAGLARLGVIDTVLALPVFRRITRSSTSPLAALTDTERDALAAEVRNPRSHQAARREYVGLLRSRAALRHLHDNDITDVPLTVISGGRAGSRGGALRRRAVAWHALLVATTPGARHIVVGQGGHFIPRYQPEVVATAVVELLGS